MILFPERMEEDPADPAASSYPVFYPQSPYGIEGGEIEAFTSYVTRLADRHSIPATVLLRLARLCHGENPGNTNASPPNSMHHSLNGYGPKAQDFARALAAVTGIPDLINLTLIPWEGAFARNAQGLLGKHLAWCSRCWEEDLVNGRTPYIRLYWLVKCVPRCYRHQTDLQRICPACLHPQRILPTIPRFRTCSSCGADMIEYVEKRVCDDSVESLRDTRVVRTGEFGQPTSAADEEKRKNWYARNAADLIGHTCAAGHGLKAGAAKKAIVDIYESGCGGSAMVLTDLAEKDKQAVYAWRSGKCCPQFQVFAELSYRLQVPLSSLLVGGDRELGFTVIPSGAPRPRFTNRRLDTPEACDRLAKRIADLADDPEPPCSLSELAQRAGTSTSTIRYRFPEVANAVIAAGKERRDAAWAADAERRAHRVAAACEQLLEAGEYPTAKKLSARFGLARSEFRKLHIQTVLKEYQFRSEASGTGAP